ncbi:MAG: hypothetical protein LC799_21030, partial [Actinobacteria bacterium]|nr:hypothetical protein [Actinomycetota bacterium]
PDAPAPGLPARRPGRARPATAITAGLAAIAVPLALLAGIGSIDTEAPAEFRAAGPTTGPLVPTPAPGTTPPVRPTPPVPPGAAIPAPASGRLATAPEAVRRGAPAGSPVAGPIGTSVPSSGAPAVAGGLDTAPLQSRRDPVSDTTSPDSTSPPPRQLSPSPPPFPFPPPFPTPPPPPPPSTPTASTSPPDPSTTTRSEDAPAETDTPPALPGA